MSWYWDTRDIAGATGLWVEQVRSLLGGHRRIGTSGVGGFGKHQVTTQAFESIFGAIAAEHRRCLELEAEMERRAPGEDRRGPAYRCRLRRQEAEERLRKIRAAEPYRARYRRRVKRGYRPARYPLSTGGQAR